MWVEDAGKKASFPAVRLCFYSLLWQNSSCALLAQTGVWPLTVVREASELTNGISQVLWLKTSKGEAMSNSYWTISLSTRYPKQDKYKNVGMVTLIG